MNGFRFSFILVLIVSFALIGLSAFSTAQAERRGGLLSKCATGFANMFRHHPHDEIESAHPTAETLATVHYDLRMEPKRIEFARIQNVMHSEDANGTGFEEALKGRLDGRDVFVKVSTIQVGNGVGERRTFHEFQNEVAWVKRLSDLGIGPRFIGITEKDGYHAIVTEFIEGHHLSIHRGRKLPYGYRPSAKLLESFEHLIDVIRHEGFQFQTDMRFPDIQVRIMGDRAFVIDPEYFVPAKNAAEVEKSVAAIRTIVEHLKSGFYSSPYAN